MLLLTVVTLSSFVGFAHCPDTSVRDYDVIVVGAGGSGIAAAIQAARQGASVALLEEGNMIGGQMAAAGVTSMDRGTAPPVRSGLFSEYRDRVHDYYNTLHMPEGGYTAST